MQLRKGYFYGKGNETDIKNYWLFHSNYYYHCNN